jgi:hypothetical protein
MWTLIIVVLLASPGREAGTGNGASVAISSLDFRSEKTCEAAAKVLSQQGSSLQSGGGVSAATFEIRANCVARE